MLRVAQLLLLLLSFLSGSRWVLSYKILFLIPSLAILSWILCLAKLYLQWNQHPKVTRINPPTPTSHDLLILLVTKKCPSPATTDPSEPYRIDSRAHGMFSTSKIPRSLKGFFSGSWGSRAAAMGASRHFRPATEAEGHAHPPARRRRPS